MKLLLPSALSAAAFATMVSAETVVHKKPVTIKLYHHQGLSLPDHCEGALVTGFLVAYNTVSAKQEHDFAAMNLKTTEQYFEYENDDIPGASTAWITATFDATCESCDFNENNPPVLFRNPNDFLSDSVIHHDIEMEMLHQLKDGNMCDAFESLQDLEIIYAPSRRTVVESTAAGSDTVALQQSVLTTMEGVNKELIGNEKCESAFGEAWMAAFQKSFVNDNAELVKTLTVDSSTVFTGEAMVLEDIQEEEVSTPILNKTNLRSKIASGDVEEKDTTPGLAHAQYRAHLDIEMAMDRVHSFIANRVFSNKNEAFARAALHSEFEKSVQEELRNSKCEAYKSVSDVSVRFQGPYTQPEDVLEDNKEEVIQATVINLFKVDFSIVPSDSCFADFTTSLITAYNIVHPEQDTLTMNSAMLHSLETTPVEEDDRRQLSELVQLDFIHFDLRFMSFIGGVCRLCRNDDDFMFSAMKFPALEFASFETELVRLLKASDCNAFHSITGASISFVDDFPEHKLMDEQGAPVAMTN